MGVANVGYREELVSPGPGPPHFCAALAAAEQGRLGASFGACTGERGRRQ
jgi:hypothetical protein